MLRKRYALSTEISCRKQTAAVGCTEIKMKIQQINYLHELGVPIGARYRYCKVKSSSSSLKRRRNHIV